MRLAIDASRCTVPRVTGTERYAIELIRHLIRHNTQHEITLYFRDEPQLQWLAAWLGETVDQVTLKTIPFRRAWTHLRLARELWRDRPDLTFVPAHTLPFVFPGRGAVTAHDLGYRHFPEAHPWQQRVYLDLTTHYSAARARVVLADSVATADDLTRFYGISPVRIRVVYPGVEAPVIQDRDAVRAKYVLPERYFLFIGTLQPRKNIARLVQAFQAWRRLCPDDPAELLLAGGTGWLFDPAWVEDVPGVRLLGYIDEGDKGALLAGALAFVFPSLYEGFGFPVLEAMGCGTPVIASQTSSLPELVGEAGLLVDPLSVESIAGAMRQLSQDEPLRQTLLAKGQQQATIFTWDTAARAAWDALEWAIKP